MIMADGVRVVYAPTVLVRRFALASHSSSTCRLLDDGLTTAARPTGFHRSRQAATGGEFAAYGAPDWFGGGDDIAQNAVHGVLIEDAEIPVSQQVMLQSL